MTQAFNLSQLGNTINSSGQVSLTSGVTGTLPTTNGGTGLTTVGTNGQVLTSNGSTLSWVSPSGGQYQAALFASTGSWTAPAGVTRVKITIFGGGGGGANQCGGGSGGSGGAGWNYFTVTPGTSYTVTIGSGGANTNPGGAGGSSSFGALITATGGGGGASGGGNGASGSCANALTSTVATYFGQGFTPISVYGFAGIPFRSGNGAAAAWSASSSYLPGTSGNEATGGVGGACLIEYIG